MNRTQYKTLNLLLLLLIISAVASAQNLSDVLDAGLIIESDMRDSAIAFVNMSTTPGLEGAVLTADNNK